MQVVLLLQAMPHEFKFFWCFSMINARIELISKFFTRVDQPTKFLTSLAHYIKFAASMYSIRNTSTIAAFMALSWSVIIFLGSNPPIASFKVQNTQTNDSIVSSGSKAQPSNMLYIWLFTPTMGANGMLYLLTENVVSKKIRSLKVLYISLVLPSTQNSPLTGLSLSIFTA